MSYGLDDYYDEVSRDAFDYLTDNCDDLDYVDLDAGTVDGDRFFSDAFDADEVTGGRSGVHDNYRSISALAMRLFDVLEDEDFWKMLKSSGETFENLVTEGGAPEVDVYTRQMIFDGGAGQDALEKFADEHDLEIV